MLYLEGKLLIIIENNVKQIHNTDNSTSLLHLFHIVYFYAFIKNNMFHKFETLSKNILELTQNFQ